MRRFQQSPVFRFMYSPLTVVALGVLVALLARSSWGVYKKEVLARERSEAALYQLRELQERKENLLQTVTSLENEEGMEEALREKYSVAKEGERVIVISGETSTTSEKKLSQQNVSFWDRFMNFFK